MCIMLIIILKSFYYQKIDISFIKDIFSIGATLAAALIAVSLFNDWKEQHNKTILAPEAIEIYKLINADIKISAEYINLIKNNVNKNLQPLLAVEIFEKFGEFVEIREKRTVELMYFATLAKNEEIGGLIHEYASCVDKQLNYLNPIMRSQQIIDQNFINNNNIFIKELTKIQLEINKKLSDYILLK
ncbi:hypothetical protein [Acinetobacter baumannii]|uniref:hypothetical protein n=1 Tax=Acinetobacter baumannii TaxID=470 RepID=UPI003DA098FC